MLPAVPPGHKQVPTFEHSLLQPGQGKTRSRLAPESLKGSLRLDSLIVKEEEQRARGAGARIEWRLRVESSSLYTAHIYDRTRPILARQTRLSDPPRLGKIQEKSRNGSTMKSQDPRNRRKADKEQPATPTWRDVSQTAGNCRRVTRTLSAFMSGHSSFIPAVCAEPCRIHCTDHCRRNTMFQIRI
ncbi:hypothetical protein NDU88_001214 [Pleurodeles waltl]|uniref:Uncharacterized protein n=1 Tax=Pleurodeles waltl TaxID=8319 RepID=A0AAV7U6A2_PLEWA|nr:hypothetical protein NDU88_001214 [Pleurodeles waltl]